MAVGCSSQSVKLNIVVLQRCVQQDAVAAARTAAEAAAASGTSSTSRRGPKRPINSFWVSKEPFAGRGGYKKRCLLAVEKGAVLGSRVRVYRPQTGANDYDRDRLQGLYERIKPQDVKEMWENDFRAAGAEDIRYTATTADSANVAVAAAAVAIV
jgi:hypothetical protein